MDEGKMSRFDTEIKSEVRLTAILPCRRGVIDALTNRMSLFELLTEIRAERLPVAEQSFSVFASFERDAIGTAQIDLAAVLVAPDGSTIYRHQFQLAQWNDAHLDMFFDHAPVTFTADGAYHLCVFADGALLGRRRILVQLAETEGS